MEFNKEDFMDKLFVVNCETEKEAKRFLKYLETKKFYWLNGEKPTKNTCWDSFKKNTCYEGENGFIAIGRKEDFKVQGYQVIQFKEFSNVFICDKKIKTLEEYISDMMNNLNNNMKQIKKESLKPEEIINNEEYNKYIYCYRSLEKVLKQSKNIFNPVDFHLGNVCVNCETEEEAIRFLNYITNLPDYNLDSKITSEKHFWGENKKDTCYFSEFGMLYIKNIKEPQKTKFKIIKFKNLLII